MKLILNNYGDLNKECLLLEYSVNNEKKLIQHHLCCEGCALSFLILNILYVTWSLP